MLARDNYSFQKRKKELAREKKREEKRQRKVDRKNIQPREGEAQVSNENSEQSLEEKSALNKL